MTLKSDQIELLYKFTEQHYVEFYDVQTELVDHLANGIEQQWRKNPDLSFNDALNREFKKFGVMGFGPVLEERTKALSKLYWRIIWSHFRQYFGLPKLLMTTCLIVCYHQLLVYSMQYHINWVLIPTLTLIFGIPWYYLIREYRRSGRIKKVTGKKWLFDQNISQLGGIVHLMNFAIYFQVFFHTTEVWPNWLSLIFSVLAISFGLLMYVAIFRVAPKMRRDMAKQYPDYVFL